MERRGGILPPLPFTNVDVAEVDINDYDRVRVPHKLIPDGVTNPIGSRTFSTELSCPICLDLLSQTLTAKDCLHRFCSDCITMALQRGNKECPTCRKKLVSKRSLRADPKFDMLIQRIWPNRRLYEKMQTDEMNSLTSQSSTDALMDSIGDGMRVQDMNRRKRIQGSYDEVSNEECEDVPSSSSVLYRRASTDSDTTDPANAPMDAEEMDINDDDDGSTLSYRNDKEAKEDMYDLEEDDQYEFLDEEIFDVHPELASDIAADLDELEALEDEDIDELDEYTDMPVVIEDEDEQEDHHDVEDEDTDDTDEDSKESDGSIEEIEDEPSDDSKEEGAADTSVEEATSDTSIGEITSKTSNVEVSADTTIGEVPADTSIADESADISSEEVSPDISIGAKINNSTIEEATPNTSIGNITNDNTIDEGFADTTIEEAAPDTSMREAAADISSEEIPADTSSEEVPIDTSSEDIPADNSMEEGPADISVEENEPVLNNLINNDDASTDSLHGDDDRDLDSPLKIVEDEEMDSGPGSSGQNADSEHCLIPPPLDLQESYDRETHSPDSLPPTPPYCQGIPAEDMENISPPSEDIASRMETLSPAIEISQMIPGHMDPEEAIADDMDASELIPIERVPLTMLQSDLIESGGANDADEELTDEESDSSSSTYSSSGATSSLSSSSTDVTLSSDEEDQTPNDETAQQSATYSLSYLTKDLAGMSDIKSLSPITLTEAEAAQPIDRLAHWLDNSPSSPEDCEDYESLERAQDEEMEGGMFAEDIEAELLPAASLFGRKVPQELLAPRYIKTKHDTKMEHVGEFLFQRTLEEIHANQNDFDADPNPHIPRPSHFYVMNRIGGHHVYKIFPQESIATAALAGTREEHLTIFYDTEEIDLKEPGSLLLMVVPPQYLALDSI